MALYSFLVLVVLLSHFTLCMTGSSTVLSSLRSENFYLKFKAYRNDGVKIVAQYLKVHKFFSNYMLLHCS